MKCTPAEYYIAKYNEHVFVIYCLHNEVWPIGCQSIKIPDSSRQGIYSAYKTKQKLQARTPLFTNHKES